MDKTAELLDRIAALELRVAQLEARPQPAQTISHGGMWAWPWGTQTAASVAEIMAGQQYTASVMGNNVSRETSKRPNGDRGPK
jgi:hypothetical protein